MPMPSRAFARGSREGRPLIEAMLAMGRWRAAEALAKEGCISAKGAPLLAACIHEALALPNKEGQDFSCMALRASLLREMSKMSRFLRPMERPGASLISGGHFLRSFGRRSRSDPIANGSSPLDAARAAADVGNGIDREIFSMTEAAVAQRQLVVDFEASARPAPSSQAPTPRL